MSILISTGKKAPHRDFVQYNVMLSGDTDFIDLERRSFDKDVIDMAVQILTEKLKHYGSATFPVKKSIDYILSPIGVMSFLIIICR